MCPTLLKKYYASIKLTYNLRQMSSWFLLSLAPGSYNVEKADKKIHESSPAYSLGKKHKDKKPEQMPGTAINYL